MNDWNELDTLLQKHDYNYINDWGVMFNRVEAGFMLVDGPWPAHHCADVISLVYLCKEASEFYDRLEIKDAQQIEQVKPEILLKLFFAGDVILVCTVNDANNGDTVNGDTDDETLEFSLKDGQLIAFRADCEIGHVVVSNLEKPEDFIEYTKQYFLNLKEEPASMN